MRKLCIAATLVLALAPTPPVHGAGMERWQSAVPEDLADAWDRLQRALQDWGDQLRERFGSRESHPERPVISELLSYRDYLRLTPEQVKKLEQLRDTYQRQSIRNEADARILELDIAALLDNPNVDVAKVESKIREVEKLRADLRIARVRAIEQAKDLLTLEQRKKFDETLRAGRRGLNPPASESPSR